MQHDNKILLCRRWDGTPSQTVGGGGGGVSKAVGLGCSCCRNTKASARHQDKPQQVSCNMQLYLLCSHSAPRLMYER